VTPQRALAVVGRADAFILELQADEYDIARVKTGQQVMISMDSYKGQVLEAQVTRIHPIMDPRSRTFTIEAEFIKAPPALFPYLTAEANIVVAKKDRAITVPAEYVIDGRYVLTGKDTRTEVKTGLHDLQRVEILSGIDSTTALYKP
jgi:HlyD family secretion protein